jgi:hypothetical protein
MELNKAFVVQPVQKTRTGMAFRPIVGENGEPFTFLLCEPQCYVGRIPFEPSVFGGGTGKELRKSIRIELPDEILEAIAAFEDRIREVVATSDKWCSCIVPAGQHSGSLKAKIFVQGEKACVVRDEGHQEIAFPGQPWQRPICNARVEVKGVYHQSGGAGLVLHVTHLQLAQSNRKQDTYNPFIST